MKASKRLRVPAALLGFLGLSMGWYATAQERPNFEDSPFLRIDPDKIVLSDRDSRVPCGECHVDEFAVWEETPHATGFNTLHRTSSAADILESMNLQVTKRQESLCLRCHYTVDNSLRAIAGVSCESCHGAAADWVDQHNNWGPGVD
ncbi:MAG: cytochrome c family protein, partial [Longimicrobiales bacterium]